MKTILVFYLFCLASVVLANKFVVESFKKDSTDLSFKLFERKDINGDICALIKIRSATEGIKFNTNVGISGNIQYKDGEYWIYVSSGEKRIIIFKEGFIKYEYLIPIKVESGVIYRMELSVNVSDEDLISNVGFIQIASIPDKAELWLNGVKKGVTPFNNEFPVGTYNYKLKKDDYNIEEGSIIIKKGETSKLNLMLKIEITFTTEPLGSEIFIDGESKGAAPLTISLPDGNYTIKLIKENYVEYIKNLNISPIKKKYIFYLSPYLIDPRNSKKYKTIVCNNQIWMAEDLNFKTFTGSKCFDNDYNNNSKNCEKYGRQYKWKTAKKVCPSGWHLPSANDFNALLKNNNQDIQILNSKESMRVGNTLWTSSNDDSRHAVIFDIHNFDGIITPEIRGSYLKSNEAYVRCVKDK